MTTDSPSVPPESHVIPWKSSTFPLPNSPHPQAIKIDCSLILLWTVFQNFSSKMKYEKHSLEYVDLPMYWTSLDDRRSLFDTYGPFHLDILGLQKRDTKKTQFELFFILSFYLYHIITNVWSAGTQISGQRCEVQGVTSLFRAPTPLGDHLFEKSQL